MRVVPDTFISSSNQFIASSNLFSVEVDVSRVPVGEAATIGFSSFGVVDTCTGTTLALVDPLVFRMARNEQGNGRRLFTIEVGLDIGLVFPPHTVTRPNITIVSNSGV
jgi:hypothetical protein